MIEAYDLKSEAATHREIDVNTMSEADAQGLVRTVHATLAKLLYVRGPIMDFLSVRAENVLRRCEITSLQELSDYGKKFPGAGTKTYHEFYRILTNAGLPVPHVIVSALHPAR